MERKQETALPLKVSVIALMSLALMAVDLRSGWMGSVRFYLDTMIEPIQRMASLPQLAGEKLSTSVTSHGELVAQLKALGEENLELKSRLQRLESLERENDRLAELLAASRQVRDRVLLAELIDVSLARDGHQVMINRGKRDEVYLGQPVIDTHGVMGQVSSLSLNSARVTLITDHNHALPVKVRRNGLRTLVEGLGVSDRLGVPYLAPHADIAVGDVLVTSGLGDRFPAGYPVAEVIEVERRPNEPFLSVTSEPIAQMDTASEVLLVWYTPPQTLTSPDTAAEAAAEAGADPNGARVGKANATADEDAPGATTAGQPVDETPDGGEQP